MRLLDRQVLRELISPLLFGLAAFTSVFFASSYILKITEWISNGMPVMTALEIAVLVLPDTLKYTMPMATLLAVLLGVGRLSSDSEIVSMFACGISLYRVSLPVIGMGLVLSICSMVFNEYVGPHAFMRVEHLKSVALKSENSSKKPFMVYDRPTQTLVRVNGALDVEQGLVSDVTILKFDGGRPLFVMYAKTAHWGGMLDDQKKFLWRLQDGFSQTLGTEDAAIGFFEESNTREIEIKKTPEQLALFGKMLETGRTEQLSFAQLTAILNHLRNNPDRPEKDIREIEVDRWNRIAIPLATLVFAVIAAPLGIRPHRGSNAVGMGLSVLLILLYYVTWNYGCNVAISGGMPPVVGAFMADVLGIAFAFVLMRQAAK